MKQSHIYWIDKNVGRPLCLLLTLHRKLRGLREKREKRDRVEKILFVKLVEQGSTVLAHAAIKMAIARVGRENVYFLVFKENRFILELIDLLDRKNILDVDSTGFLRFVLSVMKALKTVRDRKIDAVIDMEFFSRASAILSYLTGARKRVGLHPFTNEGPYRGDLMTHRMFYNPYLHISRYFLCLVEALNHEVPPAGGPMNFRIPEDHDDPPRMKISEEEKTRILEKIASLGKIGFRKPVIILNPNASDMLPIRKWPEESFVALGKMILEKNNGTIIVSGAPDEKEKAERIAERIGGNTLSLAGHTTLNELMILYGLSDILVTNDSGPAHFSTLTPIKSVILFGPETPLLYGPCSSNTAVLRSEIVCSPCVNVFNHRRSPCLDGVCLRTIDPRDVHEKIEWLLRG